LHVLELAAEPADIADIRRTITRAARLLFTTPTAQRCP